LEATIHGIATRQQDLQPDPEAQPTTLQKLEATDEDEEDDDE